MTQAQLRKSIADHNRKCLEHYKQQNAQLVEALKDAQSVLLHATNVPYRYELLDRIKQALAGAKGGA